MSLALFVDGKVLKARSVKAERVLETSIIKKVDGLLSSAGVPFKKIEAVAVGLGPGSFTSLRVGLATVKAFALASDKKIIGVCTLDVIAAACLPEAAARKTDEICVILDARRGKVYAAIYDRDLTLKTAYMLSTIDEVLEKVKARTLFSGDGVAIYKQRIEDAYKACSSDECSALFAAPRNWQPKAQVLAGLAYQRARVKAYDDAASLSPIYLYAQDCQVNPHKEER